MHVFCRNLSLLRFYSLIYRLDFVSLCLSNTCRKFHLSFSTTSSEIKHFVHTFIRDVFNNKSVAALVCQEGGNKMNEKKQDRML